MVSGGNITKKGILFLTIRIATAALLMSATAVAQPQGDGQAAILSVNGNLKSAIDAWREQLRMIPDDADAAAIELKLKIATANCKQGFYADAFALIDGIKTPVLKLQDADLLIRWLNSAANCELAAGETENALTYMNQAVAEANSSGNEIALSYLLNDLANAQLVAGYTTDAKTTYLRAHSLSRDSAPSLFLRVTINLAKLDAIRGDRKVAMSYLQQADELVRTMPDGPTMVNDLLAMSQVAGKLRRDEESVRLFQDMYDWLNRSLGNLDTTNSKRTASFVHGYLAELYYQSGQYDVASKLVQQALVLAQDMQASDLIYRWQWRRAAILRGQGNLAEALQNYQAALETLSAVRLQLTKGYFLDSEFFNENIKALYLEFVDILLQSARGQPNSQTKSQLLSRARDTIEILKTAELEDYFKDRCSLEQQQRAVTLDDIAGNAAVLYPIILPDRLELLLSVRGQFFQETVNVGSDVLIQNAGQFELLIQESHSERYMPYANRLFNWMIAPLQTHLDSLDIKTLVIVPDTELHGIPFAALHDGQSYLIEGIEIAITPSLTLTAPKPLQADNSRALLAGVSSGVRGFAPLDEVETELAAISNQLPHDRLQDDDYTRANLENRLQGNNYSIVHLATHGSFRNTPEESYLLTHDSKLNMRDLGQLIQMSKFRDQPVELLTLSACETATGNRKAALGLAGIAIRSGARSALASFWLVDDRATATLMTHFYAALIDGELSKSAALRSAQRQLMNNPATAHPASWAPFVLIGNWL